MGDFNFLSCFCSNIGFSRTGQEKRWFSCLHHLHWCVFPTSTTDVFLVVRFDAYEAWHLNFVSAVIDSSNRVSPFQARGENLNWNQNDR